MSFGGNVSYAPQIPWIRNATLRQNILFGQPDDEDETEDGEEADGKVIPSQSLQLGADARGNEKDPSNSCQRIAPRRLSHE